MKALGIWNVDGHTRDMLLGVCLNPEEREQLLEDCERCQNGLPSSEDARRRTHINAECRDETCLARKVTDLLDLRYLDEIQYVRHMEPGEVAGVVADASRRGVGRDLPGLLWALSTDPRPAVRNLGRIFGLEVLTNAYELLREVVGFAAAGNLDEVPPEARRKSLDS